MKLLRKKGVTSQIIELFIQDTRLGDGGGLTGLVHNTGSLTAYYHRNTAAAAVAVTLADMTVGTFTSSGFKVVDGTNMPGVYQLCLPDAAYASGADSFSFMLKGASNMVVVIGEIQLIDIDLNDTVRAGLTALPNAAAGAAGGLIGAGTGSNQIDLTGGKVKPADSSISNTTFAAGAIDAAALATDALGSLELSAGAVTEIQTGLATAASIALLNNLSAAQVNAEVVDALATDTYAEPGQGAPGATLSLAAKINYLYKLMRNKVTQTSTAFSVYDDAGTIVDQKATVSDDGTTFTRGEIATGP